jgi:hypothetical protein
MFEGLIEKSAALVGAVITNAFVSIFFQGDNWISRGVILISETIGSDYAVNIVNHFVMKHSREGQRKKKHPKNHHIDDLEQDGGINITDTKRV